MTKILTLWTTPRATSTAFEWVMKNRGDFTCYHEPYNEAFYYGLDRRHNRYFDDDQSLQPTAGLTFSKVDKMLAEQALSSPVFIKEFAYSIMHMADEKFLDRFQHTFLIRDPKKVITSMHSRWPDVVSGELGFEDLYTLFKRICARDGAAPTVIDSDEFVNEPEAMMAAYCAAVGIPYIAESLTWEKQTDSAAKKTVSWNDDRHGFHDSLVSSSGIAPQKRAYPPLESDQRMLDMYAAARPHYEALYEHRLQPVATERAEAAHA